MLCKKGEIKTGLSLYYVRLCDCGQVLNKMLKILIQFLPDSSDTFLSFQKQWIELEQFLQYQYAINYIAMSFTCKAYCVKYGLNSNIYCEYVHITDTCKDCSEPFLFFESLEASIQDIVIISEEDARKEELESIKKAYSQIFLPTVISYMDHQMRAVAQFAKLKKKSKISLVKELESGLTISRKFYQ